MFATEAHSFYSLSLAYGWVRLCTANNNHLSQDIFYFSEVLIELKIALSDKRNKMVTFFQNTHQSFTLILLSFVMVPVCLDLEVGLTVWRLLTTCRKFNKKTTFWHLRISFTFMDIVILFLFFASILIKSRFPLWFDSFTNKIFNEWFLVYFDSLYLYKKNIYSCFLSNVFLKIWLN